MRRLAVGLVFAVVLVAVWIGVAAVPPPAVVSMSFEGTWSGVGVGDPWWGPSQSRPDLGRTVEQDLEEGVRWVQGPRGQAARLRVEVSVSPPQPLKLGNAATAQLWFRFDSDDPLPESGGYELDGVFQVFRTEMFSLDVRPNGSVPIFFFLATGGHYNEHLHTERDPVTIGQWRHLAMVRDGEFTRLYVDGVRVHERRWAPDDYEFVSVIQRIRLGDIEVDGPNWVVIDEVRIYDYVRTDRQIARDARR